MKKALPLDLSESDFRILVQRYLVDTNRMPNLYPEKDDTYYLGRNDDDSPQAWKGVILKDQGNGKYYRIEMVNGVVTATDLTD